jgi:WD40 repeat protein
VTSIDFSTNSEHLASADLDGEALIWDLTSNLSEPIVRVEPDGRTVAFSDNWLATGDSSGAVHLLNLNDISAESLRLSGHNDVVTSLVFSPDGTVLASGSTDGAVRLWLVR